MQSAVGKIFKSKIKAVQSIFMNIFDLSKIHKIILNAHMHEVYTNQNAPVDVTLLVLIVQTFTLY